MSWPDQISPGRAPLLDRLAAHLSPPAFLSFLVIGFLCSVAAGYFTSRHNMFFSFVRIHQLIGTESLFNVSALQIYRLLEQFPSDKILVVVGGTSRFNGTGQRPHELWSHHLQEQLGPDYVVVNLALRAGTTEQGGAQAAEALIKEGRRVIFVADWNGNRSSPVGGQPRYWYLFYDWMARDLLLDWAPRQKALEDFETKKDDRYVAAELRLRAALNRLFYFDEFWNWIGYRHIFFAAWHPLIRLEPLAPRSGLADPEERLPPNCCYQLRDFEQQMQVARTFASARFMDDHLVYASGLGLIVPPPLHERSVIVWLALSPFYTAHLSERERSIYTRNMVAAADRLGDAGFHAVEFGRDWTTTDFVDVFHLSETGGKKLADAVAPHVVNIARHLGYIQ